MKKIRKFFIILFTFLFTLALLLSVFFMILVNTKWGQNQIKSALYKTAQNSGATLTIKDISASFPFYIVLSDVKIDTSTYLIESDKISFSINLKSIIKKEIALNSLQSQSVIITDKNKNIENSSIEEKSTIKKAASLLEDKEKETSKSIKTNSNSNINSLNLPISISINRLDIKNINYNGLVNFSINGNIFLKKHLRHFLLNLSLCKKDEKKINNLLRLSVKGSKRSNYIKSTLLFKTDNISIFEPAITFDQKGKYRCKIKMTDTFVNFEKFLYSTNSDNIYLLKGHGEGYFYPDSFKKYNLSSAIFNFEGSFSSTKEISIPRLYAENNFMEFKGAINTSFLATKTTAENSIPTITGKIKVNDLSFFNNFLPVNLKGKAFAEIKSNLSSINLDYVLPMLHINKYPLIDCKGSILLNIDQNNYLGNVTSEFITFNEKFVLSSNYIYNERKALKLEKLFIESPSSKISADISFIPTDNKSLELNGDIFGELNNLNIAKEFVPYEINGMIEFNSQFKYIDNMQNVHLIGSLTDFHIEDLFGEKIEFNIDLKDVYKEITHSSKLNGINTRFEKLKLETFSFTSVGSMQATDITFDANGKWRSEFNFASKGHWKIDENKRFNLNIDEINGTIFKRPFYLAKNSILNLDQNYFALKDFILKMDESQLNIDILLSESKSSVNIVGEHVPLDFLSFNPLELSIEGSSSFKALYSQTPSETYSNISIDIEDISIASIADQSPSHAKGNIQAKLKDDYLHLDGHLLGGENNILKINAKMPLDIKLKAYDIDIKIDNDKSIDGEMSINASIEDIIDFFDIGNQRIEGDLTCNFLFSKTLHSPKIEGYCKISNGQYENYITGTMLHDIDLSITSENHKAFLKSFTAVGSEDGTLAAKGHFDLRASEKYPYSLNVELNNIKLIQTDLASAAVKGNLEISGDIKQTTAKGEIDLSKAEFHIPDKIPMPMPEMPVTFVNKRHVHNKIVQTNRKYYPINLDLLIKSSDKIYVTGRGVSAQLKGSVKLSGTTQDIIPVGKLDLVKGSYSFSGRQFDLKEGNLVFSGKAGVAPTIFIKADTMQKGVQIIATLKGPLNAPELRFSSSPPLSVSSIISLLLFGEDLSGISALQALQVASTLATFSQSNSALENTKKSLGIDRLAIISRAGETADDPDQIAVEVGKYITRGLLVSFKQGTEEGTSNASAEIDLGLGFVFQFETIQEEEQTRFTLKWGHNF